MQIAFSNRKLHKCSIFIVGTEFVGFIYGTICLIIFYKQYENLRGFSETSLKLNTGKCIPKEIQNFLTRHSK